MDDEVCGDFNGDRVVAIKNCGILWKSWTSGISALKIGARTSRFNEALEQVVANTLEARKVRLGSLQTELRQSTSVSRISNWTEGSNEVASHGSYLFVAPMAVSLYCSLGAIAKRVVHMGPRNW
jgi:hypothetical protein